MIAGIEEGQRLGAAEVSTSQVERNVEQGVRGADNRKTKYKISRHMYERNTPEGLDEWTRREERRSCNNSSSREN